MRTFTSRRAALDAPTAAVRARVLHDRAAPAAARAHLRERERALVDEDLAGAAAVGADVGRRARASRRSRGTPSTPRRLVKLTLVVTPCTASRKSRWSSVSRSAPGRGPPAAGPTAPRGRRPAAPPRRTARRGGRRAPRPRRTGTTGSRSYPPAPPPGKPPRIAPDATISRTSSYSLRLSASPRTSYARRDLLEPLLGLRVARVGVGVVLLRQLPVGARDVLLGRALRHAEHLVVVGVEPLALRCHVAPPGYRATFTMAGRSTLPL